MIFAGTRCSIATFETIWAARSFSAVAILEISCRFLKQTLDASAVFIDVGANQGEFTIAAAGIVQHGKIIAFEPVKEYRDRLVENIRLNGYSNIQIVTAALGDADGEMPIFDAEGAFPDGTKHDGLTTLFASATRSSRRETVAVKTLDSILPQLAVNRVDLIKLDIEGAEWMALRGAINTLAKYRPSCYWKSERKLVAQQAMKPKTLSVG